MKKYPLYEQLGRIVRINVELIFIKFKLKNSWRKAFEISVLFKENAVSYQILRMVIFYILVKIQPLARHAQLDLAPALKYSDCWK
ncbi:hypothetical protein [Parafilimonas sp.]|uniref:hypothetical protein n=1 Tax=Parafilimonas sp. TaxID=1969739 RepID=UPI003F81B7B2